MNPELEAYNFEIGAATAKSKRSSTQVATVVGLYSIEECPLYPDKPRPRVSAADRERFPGIL